MNILGLSCYYHDSAACLVRDGRIVAAAQEERFDRQKNSPRFPVQAINYCLQEGGITIQDVDRVAFYEKPFLKLERVVLSHLRSWPRSLKTFLQTLPPWLEERLVLPVTLEKQLGFSGRVHFLNHHLAHAASSFLASPFEEAAILTADGVGEWATTTLGQGRGTRLEMLQELRYPDSLGLLYTAVTTWLGFEALRGEGKVMALADFGEPRYLEKLKTMVRVEEDGSFKVDTRYFSFLEGGRMFSRRFEEVFGPARTPGAELTPHHQDMAASLQALLEEVMVKTARHLHRRTGHRNLCLAGGICLNISATTRLLRDSPFEQLFIQPAAGDSGTALGAALFLHHALTGKERGTPMTHAYLGPQYSREQIRRLLLNRGMSFREYSPDELVGLTARRIADGRIVGWFQGRMELGPRALGGRSILADPRRKEMKDVLNAKVKHRESFRPYGVSILLEDVGEFFHSTCPSPFMLQVALSRPEVRDRIPSAIHVNGTSRLQTLTRADNGIYYDLVRAFKELTGTPMVINTSFNDNNEPIVCTPEDALLCFSRTRMDCLAMGPFLVEKADNGAS